MQMTPRMTYVLEDGLSQLYHTCTALRRDVEGVVAALTRNHATVPSGERERGGNDLWQKQQYPSRIHT
jgi:hypothetical protein